MSAGDRNPAAAGDDPAADRPPALASRKHTARLLFILIAVAALVALQARAGSSSAARPAAPASRLPLYLSALLLEGALVWFVNLGVRHHGRRLGDLVGRRWRSAGDAATDLALAVGAVLAMRGVVWVLHSLLGPAPARTGFLLPHGAAESALWIAVAMAAGLAEEIVFRGYLQRQLWALTGSLPLALVGQSLVFGVAHLYQGWRPALVTVLYGLVFGLLAAWRRSILPGTIAHALVDLLGGLARG